MTLGARYIVLALPLLLAGCVTASRQENLADVREMTRDRVGESVYWRDGSSHDRRIDQLVRETLTHPLAVEQAVQIALLNNRELQASMEELGIARADLVEAGLLSNPVFSAVAKFPEGGGSTNIELGLTQSFLDALLIPLRRRVAAAELESVKLEIASEVVELAHNVREAYYTLAAADTMMNAQRQIMQTAESSADIAARLHAAGNITDLELAQHHAELGEARLALSEAELELIEHRERLNVLMGLWGNQTAWSIQTELPSPIPSELKHETFESFAMRERLDLAAARQATVAAAQRAGIAGPAGILGDSKIGVEAEREEGDWRIGPAIAIPIPIFDTGSAARDRTVAELRQVQHRYYASAVAARAEVRQAYVQMRSAENRANYLRTVVLPLHQQIVEHTQLSYNAMTSSVFELLEAKREQLAAEQDLTAALRDYWIARSKLQTALGGKFPDVDATPTTAPADQHEQHNHDGHGE